MPAAYVLTLNGMCVLDQVVTWICHLTGRALKADTNEFIERLRDGEILLEVAQYAAPEAVAKVKGKINTSNVNPGVDGTSSTPRVAVKALDKINQFLTICRIVNVHKDSLFLASDLRERRDVFRVLDCLLDFAHKTNSLPGSADLGRLRSKSSSSHHLTHRLSLSRSSSGDTPNYNSTLDTPRLQQHEDGLLSAGRRSSISQSGLTSEACGTGRQSKKSPSGEVTPTSTYCGLGGSGAVTPTDSLEDGQSAISSINAEPRQRRSGSRNILWPLAHQEFGKVHRTPLDLDGSLSPRSFKELEDAMKRDEFEGVPEFGRWTSRLEESEVTREGSIGSSVTSGEGNMSTLKKLAKRLAAKDRAVQELTQQLLAAKEREEALRNKVASLERRGSDADSCEEDVEPHATKRVRVSFVQNEKREKQLELEVLGLREDAMGLREDAAMLRQEVEQLREDGEALRAEGGQLRAALSRMQAELDTCMDEKDAEVERRQIAESKLVTSLGKIKVVEKNAKALRNDLAKWSKEPVLPPQESMRPIIQLGNMLLQMQAKCVQVSAENKRLYNEVQDLKGNIRVFCRVRPINPREAADGLQSAFCPGDDVVLVKSPKGGSWKFTFDKVYGPTSLQEEVFADTMPLIRSVIDGYNVCIFAYGQTGSGKTHTMMGPSGKLSDKTMGVNYRALQLLFQLKEEKSSEWKHDIGVEMVEIYNETIRDLLMETDLHATSGKGGGTSRKLEMRMGEGGQRTADAVRVSVQSPDDVIHVMELGGQNRAVGSTNMNERSSRSHCVVTVRVEGIHQVTGDRLFSSLHLVDLAGSERISRSEATGDRLREAQHINKSLSALGDVIQALVEKRAHVPFRNSKLTQMLQDSLGGYSKALMFAHASPDELSVQETVSTLNFAARVKTVELGAAKKNKGAVNDYREKLATTERELEEIRMQLREAQSAAENGSSEKNQELKSLREKTKKLEAENEKLQAQVRARHDQQPDKIIVRKTSMERKGVHQALEDTGTPGHWQPRALGPDGEHGRGHEEGNGHPRASRGRNPDNIDESPRARGYEGPDLSSKRESSKRGISAKGSSRIDSLRGGSWLKGLDSSEDDTTDGESPGRRGQTPASTLGIERMGRRDDSSEDDAVVSKSTLSDLRREREKKKAWETGSKASEDDGMRSTEGGDGVGRREGRMGSRVSGGLAMVRKESGAAAVRGTKKVPRAVGTGTGKMTSAVRRSTAGDGVSGQSPGPPEDEGDFAMILGGEGGGKVSKPTTPQMASVTRVMSKSFSSRGIPNDSAVGQQRSVSVTGARHSTPDAARSTSRPHARGSPDIDSSESLNGRGSGSTAPPAVQRAKSIRMLPSGSKRWL